MTKLRYAALLSLLVGTAAPAHAADCLFANVERVQIEGYSGTAMEPFVTRDGLHLLFNDSNDPANDTNLHYAQRASGGFVYRGKLHGANSLELDAVPSTDDRGVLYFVSSRSYGRTFSTIHRGSFASGTVRDVEIVPGVARGLPGFVNFDAEISSDGETLVFVDGFLIPGGPVPLLADLMLAHRSGRGFAPLGNSSDVLKDVNTFALEYAPALSSDRLELLFTRWFVVPGTAPRIYRSTRRSTSEPFGPPELVEALTGFVEAPALSPGGRFLYFHHRDDDTFHIYRARRCRT